MRTTGTTAWRGLRAAGWSCLLAALSVSSFAEQGKLLVKTVLCRKIAATRPIAVHLSVFDVEKAPEIARLSKEIQTSPNCAHESTADACLKLYDKLRRLATATHALVRMESLPGPVYTVSLPLVRQVLVLAYDKNGSEPSVYVQQRMVMANDEENEVVLDFSAQEACSDR